MANFSIYIRVSTQKQGNSGLGLEAQKETCTEYVLKQGGTVSKVFVDIESGKSRTRKGLWEAIDHCKENKETLVIAKLDRLARDIEFTFRVFNTGIDIHFCDMPVVNTIILGVFASVAQYERELTSMRTTAALKAKRERGEATCGDPECWGRVTGTSREEVVRKAAEESANLKREAARNNSSNRNFWFFMQDWEEAHGTIDKCSDWNSICSKLNSRGYRTPTGLEFTRSRAMAMYTKVKELYA